MGFLNRTSLLLFTLISICCISACDSSKDVNSASDIAATAKTTASQAITISDPRIRATAPGQKVSGAFMQLSNASDTPFALTSASFDAAAAVEIHETSMDGKMMRMMQVEQIEVPAGGTVELVPGGYHIMLMGLAKELKAGTSESLTLSFSDDSEMTIQALVSDLNN